MVKCRVLLIITNVIIISVSLLLSNCGFKLRGAIDCPASLKYIAINYYGNQQAPFYHKLRAALNKIGVIVDPPQYNLTKDKVILLNIDLPDIQEIINGYDSSGQVSLVKVMATCNYKLLASDNNILIEQTIVRAHNYNRDPNQLLANTYEKQQIIEELTEQIIAELIEQLSMYNLN